MRELNSKYTYYRIDVKNCSSLEWDYTIVETHEDIVEIAKLIDGDFDDWDEMDSDTIDEKPSFTISPVVMTPSEFAEWQKDTDNEEYDE